VLLSGTQDTSYGTLAPPLGSARLAVIALLGSLLSTGSPVAERAVVDSGCSYTSLMLPLSSFCSGTCQHTLLIFTIWQSLSSLQKNSGHTSTLSSKIQIDHCSESCISVKVTPAHLLASLHKGTHKDCRLVIMRRCLLLSKSYHWQKTQSSTAPADLYWACLASCNKVWPR